MQKRPGWVRLHEKGGNLRSRNGRYIIVEYSDDGDVPVFHSEVVTLLTVSHPHYNPPFEAQSLKLGWCPSIATARADLGSETISKRQRLSRAKT